MKSASQLEADLIPRVVNLGGGAIVRKMMAKVLRAYRKENNLGRAKWLRKHVEFITGHLFK